jgi:hypothetical protein
VGNVYSSQLSTIDQGHGLESSLPEQPTPGFLSQRALTLAREAGDSDPAYTICILPLQVPQFTPPPEESERGCRIDVRRYRVHPGLAFCYWSKEPSVLLVPIECWNEPILDLPSLRSDADLVGTFHKTCSSVVESSPYRFTGCNLRVKSAKQLSGRLSHDGIGHRENRRRTGCCEARRYGSHDIDIGADGGALAGGQDYQGYLVEDDCVS